VDKTLLAYTAGFFDGEGCICATRRGCRLFIANTRLIVLHSLRFKWSKMGHIYVWQSKKYPHHKPKYHWAITTGEQATHFLRHIRDYLILKSRQASLALELISLNPGSGHRLRGAALERRNWLVDEIRSINRKTPPAPHGDNHVSAREVPR